MLSTFFFYLFASSVFTFWAATLFLTCHWFFHTNLWVSVKDISPTGNQFALISVLFSIITVTGAYFINEREFWASLMAWGIVYTATYIGIVLVWIVRKVCDVREQILKTKGVR